MCVFSIKDWHNVLRKKMHQISLESGVLKMTVHSLTDVTAAQVKVTFIWETLGGGGIFLDPTCLCTRFTVVKEECYETAT